MKGGNQERLCLACRKLDRKDRMIRFVRLQGNAAVDPTQKAQGRGAYVCRNAECVTRLVEKHFLRKALHTPHDEEALETAMELVMNGEEAPDV